MRARFAATLVAFAAATAVVSRAPILAEFLVQVRDPNILGGALFATLLKAFGLAFVVALCGVLTGGAVLLVAWRTRTRGAPDIFAALAAILAALCTIGRMGVSLDPIGWICAAAFALTLERTDRASIANALAIVAIWALMQGGAPLGALLAILACVSAFIDARSFDEAVRNKAFIAIGATILGVLQLHSAPWRAYGPHLLYLDAFTAGAQRDALWTSGITLPALSFCAVVVFAAWYGVRRRGRSADALSFFAVMLLAIADARNLPYFGIIAAPIVADAAASFYVHDRTLPRGSVRQYAFTFAAAAFAFIAIITATEPKAIWWPQAHEQPARLLVTLAKDRHAHRVLCEQPRWCDGVHSIFPNIRPLMDDRAGIASTSARRTQRDAVATHGPWRRELAASRVDAVIASNDANIVALLLSTGWHASKRDDARVLLQRGGPQ
jgi:hypothetical protein